MSSRCWEHTICAIIRHIRLDYPILRVMCTTCCHLQALNSGNQKLSMCLTKMVNEWEILIKNPRLDHGDLHVACSASSLLFDHLKV